MFKCYRCGQEIHGADSFNTPYYKGYKIPCESCAELIRAEESKPGRKKK